MTTTVSPTDRTRVGSARPNQLLFTYGVGAQIDLPNISVVVAGLEAWDAPFSSPINEARLLANVQAALGPQVERLAAFPWLAGNGSPFEDSARVGVPVLPFPRWLRCTACDLLAALDDGPFQFRPDVWRPDRSSFVHEHCQRRKKPPHAVPARLVIACDQGHLDDFPWIEFAHDFRPCTAPKLFLTDVGSGTRSTDLQIECKECGQKKRVGSVFADDSDPRRFALACRGREIHLRRFAADVCRSPAKTVLLGASNLWFAETRSAFALPTLGNDELASLVTDCWNALVPLTRDFLVYALENVPMLAELRSFDPERIWVEIERRRDEGEETEPELDLKRPEWERFSDPDGQPVTEHFEIARREVPATYAARFSGLVAAPRLREVIALVGFARIDAPDSGIREDDDERRVALSASEPRWVPAAENRGEGLFLQIREDAIAAWVSRADVMERLAPLGANHRYRRPSITFPGARYVLLHSLAHALINEVALDCGYSAASIRERIYADDGESGVSPMAGILLYTAAPDAEGTLGGLVSLAETERFCQVLDNAVQRARICTSDPLCAEHVAAADELGLHGSACHACLLLPETSCEVGNRYLDRTLLVDTVCVSGIGYLS